MPQLNPDSFYIIAELANTDNVKELYRSRRQKMLEDKIDVAGFMAWFIENYPGSVETMRKDPDYQYRFR